MNIELVRATNERREQLIEMLTEWKNDRKKLKMDGFRTQLYFVLIKTEIFLQGLLTFVII